jgi:hypothetical protein
MNKLQKAVILTGAILILIMGLFPPWFHTMSEKGFPKEERASIYSPIYKPPHHPEAKTLVELLRLYDKPDRDTIKQFMEYIDRRRWGVRLDISRLLIQWAMVAIVAAGLFLIMGDKKPKN